MMSSNVRTNNKSYLNIEGKHIQLVLKKQQRIIIIILLILLKLNNTFLFSFFFFAYKNSNAKNSSCASVQELGYYFVL